MQPGFGLKDQRVAVIGLGLMGGSLALALRGGCKEVIGLDRNPETVRAALEKGIVQRASTQPEVILPEADMIILAAPVQTILALIPQLPTWVPQGALVLDLGSTKTQVCQALAALPKPFSAVGGHPMCGKEKSSLEYAEAALFRGAPFVLVQLENSDQPALSLAEELVRCIGARPLWLDAETHDEWVAYTSHFPYLLANLMASLTPLEASPLASTGWRSTTRLAGSSVQMMSDILTTNQKNILQVLDLFAAQLAQVKTLLENSPQDLPRFLEHGKTQAHQVLSNGETHP